MESCSLNEPCTPLARACCTRARSAVLFPALAPDRVVSSGTVTVNGDSSMQIIAEEAVPVAELDLAAAKSGLDKASAKLGSSNDAEKAEAEISVETFTQMIKAIEA